MAIILFIKEVVKGLKVGDCNDQNCIFKRSLAAAKRADRSVDQATVREVRRAVQAGGDSGFGVGERERTRLGLDDCSGLGVRERRAP